MPGVTTLNRKQLTAGARDFLAADHVAIPVVMDDFGGAIQHVMGGFPNSVYIIDTRGRVAYRAN